METNMEPNDSRCYAILPGGSRCPNPTFRKESGKFSKWCEQHTPPCQKANKLYKSKCKGFEDWKCNRNTTHTQAFIYSNQLDSCIDHRRDFENRCLHPSLRDVGHKNFIRSLITNRYICKKLIQQLPSSKIEDKETLDQLFDTLYVSKPAPKEEYETSSAPELAPVSGPELAPVSGPELAPQLELPPEPTPSDSSSSKKKSKKKKSKKTEEEEEEIPENETELQMLDRISKKNENFFKSEEGLLLQGNMYLNEVRKAVLDTKQKQKIIQDAKAMALKQIYQAYNISTSIPVKKFPAKLQEIYEKASQDAIHFYLDLEKKKLFRNAIIQKYQTFFNVWDKTLSVLSKIVPDFAIIFSDESLITSYHKLVILLQTLKDEMERKIHEEEYHDKVVFMAKEIKNLKLKILEYNDLFQKSIQ